MIAIVSLLSCAKDARKCVADDDGFGSAPVVRLEPLLAMQPTNGCRARFDLVRTQADLASAYADIGAGEAPIVDFGSKVVVARVSTEAATVQWSVLANGGIILGLQGCTEPTVSCSATFYTAPSPAASLDSRTCEAVHCGFVGQGL